MPFLRGTNTSEGFYNCIFTVGEDMNDFFFKNCVDFTLVL